MAELSKRWKRSSGGFILTARISHCPNRAIIQGPTAGGSYKLQLWRANNATGNPWEDYMTSKDLKALKAIGRIEAARRLHG